MKGVHYTFAMNRTVSANTLAEIGALMGDSARANIMAALMGGQALTASELAWRAGVTAQTTSGHLAKLTEAGLLVLARQGRHRYYRLASPLVGRMLEAVMAVASVQSPPRYRPASQIDDDLRQARTCYDHVAGRLGVALADALTGRGYVELDDDGGSTTRRGERFLARFGVDLAEARRQRRSFCRPCLDWSERRPHIAGALGARLADRCLELDWIRHRKDSRALTVTRRGADGFRDLLGIRLAPPGSA
jgi:DNA-binding transcriptional ArsR family regulator